MVIKKEYMWLVGILVLVVGALFFVFSGPKVSDYASLNDFEGDVTIYKSLSCGCCSVYVNYFKNKGSSRVQVVDVGGDNSIKTESGVPNGLESCHTTIIGDYFVEGHIPLEAVNRLLKEKPDIKGIAMSGMPPGSPGMPGTKIGDFVIYAVGYDGDYEEFMRI